MNHYKTLGLSPTATLQDIKSAYRKLSLETHPDVHNNCPLKTERFKQITDAYSILSCEKGRRQYDRELKEGFHGFRNAAYAAKDATKSKQSFGFSLPRNVFIGSILGVTAVTLYRYLVPRQEEVRVEDVGKAKLVEAWLNPRTNRYEKPRPWDEEYRRLKPRIVMVNRDEVFDRK